MKKVLPILIVIIILSIAPLFVSAQDIQFVPIESIPGLTVVDASNSSSTDTYLQNLFTIFVVVAVILSVIRLMICGIQYMTSESISSKGAAKTCIQYVIGGLLLILTSYIILATINEGLVGGSFTSVTSGINVGDVSDIDNPGTIDRRQFDADNTPPQNRFELKWRNECTGNEFTSTDVNRSACESQRNSVESLKIWSVVSACKTNNAGNYEYTITATGVNCPPPGFTSPFTEEHPPAGGFTNYFDRDDLCEDALAFHLDRDNYTITQDCRDLGPPD